MPEEEALNVREGVCDHVCCFRVEVTAAGQGFLLCTDRQTWDAGRLQQGQHGVGNIQPAHRNHSLRRSLGFASQHVISSKLLL